MKINLAKSAGFCFGVKRALDIALKASALNKKIYMLGDIVHNEAVVRQIQGSGIKKINKLTCGKNKTLLIRAHGCDIKTIEKAKKLGYEIIDATCPMVKEIHKIAGKMESKGYTIIVIGDKNHDEVKGIIGQLKHKAIIIDSLRHIPVKKIKTIPKIAILVQSTQNTEKALEIAEAIKTLAKNLNFFNTICQTTRLKQKEIRVMPLENDVMIIIGSKISANTKRLYEISLSLNKNSFWINSKQELKPEWFKKVKTVGITAGASTPASTTNGIIQEIKQDKK